MKILIIMAVAMGVSMTSADTVVDGMKKGMKMPKNYRMVPMSKAEILQKGKAKMFCPVCGMTLPVFYRTNHAAHADGKMHQYCSIYCMVDEMKHGKKIADVKVVDNTTLKFIDATKAYYVVGSSKPATMAKKISKYAFGAKEVAEKFSSEFGGRVMEFDEVLELAKKDYESDTKAKKMRQAKMAKMGQKVYKKKCKEITQKFATAAEAKSHIKQSGVCGEIKGKPLQAVGLYLISR